MMTLGCPGWSAPSTLGAVMDDVRDPVMARMPDSVRELLRSVEAKCRIDFVTGTIGPDAGLRPLDGAAELIVRDPETVTPETVLHELLHAQRYYLEGVQALRSARYPTFAAKTENNLEHLVIAPLQSRLGLPDDEFWNTTSQRAWATFATKDFEELERRRVLAQLWLDTQLTTDPAIRENATDVLQKHGLHVCMENLWDGVQERLGDKDELCRFYLLELRLSPDDFELKPAWA